MNNIINDRSNFKLLTADPTSLRERQLQRFLRKFKNEGFLMKMYIKVFILQVLNQPERTAYLNYKIYLNLHQHLFRPIISSIGAYNYQLAKFLGKLLNDVISNDHSAKDIFSFVEELNAITITNKGMFLIM